MVLVDSNVLLDVLTQNPEWYQWSSWQLHQAMIRHEAAINPLIYSEIAAGYHAQQQVDAALSPLSLQRLDLPWHAGFESAMAYRKYRQQGGTKRSPLPDFYIGAHAQAAGMRFLTRDVNRYRTYFPSVELITPERISK